MKKMLVLLVVGILVAGTAFGVVDPDVNSMGFYFDHNADVFLFHCAPYMMIPVHVILTNFEYSAVYGYEFGYEIVGNFMVSATALMGVGPIDVGGGPGNHIVGLAAPLPHHRGYHPGDSGLFSSLIPTRSPLR